MSNAYLESEKESISRENKIRLSYSRYKASIIEEGRSRG